MSAEIAAAKAVAVVALDKRWRTLIAILIASVLMIYFIPLIVYMGFMSNLGDMDIDTNQIEQIVVQNMSTEEKIS